MGGTVLHDERDRLTREEALRLYILDSAWFSNEGDRKGTLAIGRYADLAVLNDDYFAVDENDIRGLESVLTIVGGKVVDGAGEYATLVQRRLP